MIHQAGMGTKHQISDLVDKISGIEHGFIGIQNEAVEFTNNHTVEECHSVAEELISSDVVQARSLGTFILGFLAAKSDPALKLLRTRVGRDADWRVQEILAKAFDRYCADFGYEKALPVIREWLSDKHPNVRRAVTEGLRIWTGRNYFKDNPGIAVGYLSALKSDESEYVRKSVGNALRDISKKHAKFVAAEIGTWDLTDKKTVQTYKLAAKFILGNKKKPGRCG